MITVATILFAIVFIILLLNSGQYERYQKKMEQRESMKNYLDSQKAQSQRDRFLER